VGGHKSIRGAFDRARYESSMLEIIRGSDEAARDAILRSPRRSIEGVEGSGAEVSLAGRVVALEAPLRSPLSRRKCVLFEVWRDGVRELGVREFGLRDDSGIARVVPSEATRVRIHRTAYQVDEERSWHEGVLRAGDVVVVSGITRFEARASGGADYRSMAGRALVLEASAVARDGGLL